MYPKKTAVERYKRKLLIIFSITAIVTVCSAGVGISAYAIIEIGNVEMAQAEIERNLGKRKWRK